MRIQILIWETTPARCFGRQPEIMKACSAMQRCHEVAHLSLQQRHAIRRCHAHPARLSSCGCCRQNQICIRSCMSDSVPVSYLWLADICSRSDSHTQGRTTLLELHMKASSSKHRPRGLHARINSVSGLHKWSDQMPCGSLGIPAGCREDWAHCCMHGRIVVCMALSVQ